MLPFLALLILTNLTPGQRLSVLQALGNPGPGVTRLSAIQIRLGPRSASGILAQTTDPEAPRPVYIETVKDGPFIRYQLTRPQAKEGPITETFEPWGAWLRF